METVIIFTGCHISQKHTIENCTPYMVSQLRKMAERHQWPMTTRKSQKNKH